MKIATWNVNSSRSACPTCSTGWPPASRTPCAFKTKCENKAFPWRDRSCRLSGPVQRPEDLQRRGHLTRKPLADVSFDIPGFADDQKRIIAGTLDGVRIVCGYFPNGQAVGSDKFAYKLAWLEALTGWLRAGLLVTPRLVLAGDYNIAPEDRDAHPDWEHEIPSRCPSATPSKALLGLASWMPSGSSSSPKSFSWWDYRMMASAATSACASTTCWCRRRWPKSAPPAWWTRPAQARTPVGPRPVVVEFGHEHRRPAGPLPPLYPVLAARRPGRPPAPGRRARKMWRPPPGTPVFDEAPVLPGLPPS